VGVRKPSSFLLAILVAIVATATMTLLLDAFVRMLT
jgi:hypothetical protein